LRIVSVSSGKSLQVADAEISGKPLQGLALLRWCANLVTDTIPQCGHAD
jgi:hypothetical protein